MLSFFIDVANITNVRHAFIEHQMFSNFIVGLCDIYVFFMTISAFCYHNNLRPIRSFLAFID